MHFVHYPLGHRVILVLAFGSKDKVWEMFRVAPDALNALLPAVLLKLELTMRSRRKNNITYGI